MKYLNQNRMITETALRMEKKRRKQIFTTEMEWKCGKASEATINDIA